MANKAPSTTDLLPFQDIRDGVIFLKNNALRMVVEISAINFELRSSDEQEAIIQQFQGFLNALDFPTEIIVQSRKFDISTYVESVQTASSQLTNELLKLQATEYIRFIQELSDLSNIMSKQFFVVLPFQATQEGEKKGGFLSGLFKKKAAAGPTGPSDEVVAAYRAQLQQRADLVIGGLSGLGLKGHSLNQEGLLKLFKGVYSPIVPVNQKA